MADKPSVMLAASRDHRCTPRPVAMDTNGRVEILFAMRLSMLLQIVRWAESVISDSLKHGIQREMGLE
jgi:hypothetical protein